MPKKNGKANGKAPGNGTLAPMASDSQRNELGQLLPGAVINPEGGRRGYAAQVRAELQEIMEHPIEGTEKATRLSEFLLKLYDRAMKGDMTAAKLILDRILPATIQADIRVDGLTAPESINQIRMRFVEQIEVKNGD